MSSGQFNEFGKLKLIAQKWSDYAVLEDKDDLFEVKSCGYDEDNKPKVEWFEHIQEHYLFEDRDKTMD